MAESHRNQNGMSTDEMVREIYERIIGDGTDDNPGLDKRVDRLESFNSTIKWVGGTVGGTILAGIGAWVWTKILGGK